MSEWRSVVTYEGFYEVSDEGQVRSVTRFDRRGRIVRGILRKPQVHYRNGYHMISLCRDGHKRQREVHALVLEAFVGLAPIGTEGCHENGNPGCNILSNLRWGTPKSNSDDARRHGTMALGNRFPGARLTPDKVRRIKALRDERKTYTEIGAMIGVNRATAHYAATGKTWRHVA